LHPVLLHRHPPGGLTTGRHWIIHDVQCMYY
jgi:hypothetical protein